MELVLGILLNVKTILDMIYINYLYEILEQTTVNIHDTCVNDV